MNNTKATDWVANLCRTLDRELVEEKARDGLKYDPVFNRNTIKYSFEELVDQIIHDCELEGDPAVTDHVDRVRDLEAEALRWFDGESPLGRLETYLEVFSTRQSSRRNIRGLATAYMRFANWEPEFTQDEAIRFLRTRHTNSMSRKTYGSVLRTFFKAQGVRRDDLPFELDRLRVSDEYQPDRKTLPLTKVRHFIDLIRRSDSPRAHFYGSLITLFGFRPIEMGRLTMDSIDQTRHILTVQTAKHGRVRVHHIPECVRPWLYTYTPERVSESQMARLWHYICRDIGFRPPKGYAWYSIRHSLITQLANFSGIPAQAIDKWGGWRSGLVSGAGMSNIYSAPNFSDLLEIDQMVLGKHPFLAFWGVKMANSECGLCR